MEEPNLEVKKENVRGLLMSATRESHIKGMEHELVQDPIAQEILHHGGEDIENIEDFLHEKGITITGVLSGAYGSNGFIFDADDKIVRLSIMPPRSVPDIDLVLMPEISEKTGNLYVQVLEKVDTTGITEEDVQRMCDALAAQGYEWHDPGIDNLGRRKNGKLVVIDGTVEKRVYD